MNIGLIDVDGKMPNLALMKSAHGIRNRGIPLNGITGYANMIKFI